MSEQLLSTLKFYADEKNYKLRFTPDGLTMQVTNDKGALARQALKEFARKKKARRK